MNLQCISQKQLPPYNSGYKLVFQDEFDRTFGNEPLDPKKWARSAPWNQSSNFTQNLYWCYPGDTTSRYWDRAYEMKDPKDTTTIKISNGTLKILTNKANYPGQVSNWPECDPKNPGYAVNGKKCRDSCFVRSSDNISRCWVSEVLPFKYTTGLLFSKEKFHRGYIEIRFKLPAPPTPPYSHQGFGPCFWLYGNDPPENLYSELDIFEMVSLNPPRGDTNFYFSTVHYADPNSKKKRPSISTSILGNKLKNDTAWHTAAAWWTSEFIKFYFDDTLYFTVQGVEEILVENLAPMNIIVGTNSPTPGQCNNFDPVYTQFPYIFEIDYIRVYQEVGNRK